MTVTLPGAQPLREAPRHTCVGRRGVPPRFAICFWRPTCCPAFAHVQSCNEHRANQLGSMQAGTMVEAWGGSAGSPTTRRAWCFPPCRGGRPAGRAPQLSGRGRSASAIKQSGEQKAASLSSLPAGRAFTPFLAELLAAPTGQLCTTAGNVSTCLSLRSSQGLKESW